MAAYAEPNHVGNRVELGGWLALYTPAGVEMVHFGDDPVLGVRVLAPLLVLAGRWQQRF